MIKALQGQARVRRALLNGLAGSAAALALAPTAFAQKAENWPSRPLRLIVPFPAGGAADVMGRAIARGLEQTLKQPVVVDNRGGAGGTIGMAAAAKAAPDGYTLLVGSTTTSAISPAIYTRLTFNPVTELVPVAQFSEVPIVVVARKGGPVATLADLRRLAAQKPGALFFGSAGEGTQSHLAGEILKAELGIEAQHVPYKGGAPALAGLLGDEVQFVFDSIAPVLPLAQAGKLQVLAVLGKRRSPMLPDVRTAAESGVPSLDIQSWNGLFMPAGTPPETVRQVAEALKAIAAQPEFAQALASFGAVPHYRSPAEFAALIDAERKRYAALVRRAGVKQD